MTQSELTPEQRQRIYLEEKARMEIRQQLEPKSTPSKSNGAAAVPQPSNFRLPAKCTKTR